jgi:cholesterol transport system auxiliary component
MTKLRVFLVITAGLGLAACVSLFPSTPAAQLYTFGVAASGAPADAVPRGFNVQRLATNFAREADGAQILTLDGDHAAYIAQARWVAPASQLFDQAVSDAFDGSSGRARLLRAGDAAAAPVSLRMDVEHFEARYMAGPKAAPTVVVSVHAVLFASADRKVLADQVFESQRVAGDNRVSAIVDAFNGAITEVLGRIVDWTEREGSPGGRG